MDDETLGLIKKWKLHQQTFLFQFGINSLSQEQLLFPSTENKPLYLDYLNHNLSKILKENNLPKMTVHGFRHTHCSLLFEAGVSIKDAGTNGPY
ncbi:MAG: tyrosine-type recombinase/integrase [Enterococcus casseliflavus]